MSDSQAQIRIRVGVAVVQDGKILLVPHYFADGRPVAWFLPGGSLKYGNELAVAAARQFEEETGLEVQCGEMLGISEKIEPETPWHSLTIAFRGVITGGAMVTEMPKYSQYADKAPKWFSVEDIGTLNCQPRELIQKALS